MKRRPSGGRALRLLTTSAMLIALGVVLLLLGSFLGILDLTAAALCGIFTLFCYREMPPAYGFAVFAATAALSLLLLPQKTPAILYAVFAGYYPLLKFRLERLPAPLAWILKLLLFNAAVTAFLLLSVYVLGTPPEAWWITLVLYLLGNPAFVLYDILLGRALALYEWRMRPRIEHLLP